MNARRENRLVPLGFGVDSNSNDTTDPHHIKVVKPTAGHKSYALAFAIDMLCGTLNGMTYGPYLTPMYEAPDQHRKLGSFMMTIDPNRFAGGAALAGVVLAAITEVKKQEDSILSPGEPEYRIAECRRREGIPIEPSLYGEFFARAGRLKIDLPFEHS